MSENNANKNERDFKGYRLIIVDCKEERIVVDDMITALVGGYVTVVNSETGLCDAKMLGLSRCSVVGATAAIDAAEEAVRKLKERTLEETAPGAIDKIKKMASELANTIFGGDEE